nr:sulfotransferase [Palleronia pontilimi]
MPRSGTTYLQTLLNAHPDIHCRGEMFDPWQIDDDGDKIHDTDALVARDRDPGGFLDRALAGDGLDTVPPVLGVKILFQHDPALFADVVPARPDLRLIHVVRSNKLAQFASMRQVEKTGAWTARADSAPVKVKAGPFWALAECNRLCNQDHLLGVWLAGLPHARLTLEYRDLFAPEISGRLSDFLGSSRRDLSSPLRKQGQNRVIDRFQNAAEIEAHFRDRDLGHWLGPELG